MKIDPFGLAPELEETVIELRELLQDGMTQPEVAGA